MMQFTMQPIMQHYKPKILLAGMLVSRESLSLDVFQQEKSIECSSEMATFTLSGGEGRVQWRNGDIRGPYELCTMGPLGSE